eukprot:scaffold85715_cov62-Phaeocystis_antarctica.AAC.4
MSTEQRPLPGSGDRPVPGRRVGRSTVRSSRRGDGPPRPRCGGGDASRSPLPPGSNVARYPGSNVAR